MKAKEVKQAEAKARQEAYDALSTEQKLSRAMARRGGSRKEIGKLQARLQKEQGS